MTFSPDGRHVLAGYDSGAVCLWTPARRPPVACHAQGSTITDAEFSADGTRFVSASTDGTAVIRRVAGGARIATLDHASRPGARRRLRPQRSAHRDGRR